MHEAFESAWEYLSLRSPELSVGCLPKCCIFCEVNYVLKQTRAPHHNAVYIKVSETEVRVHWAQTVFESVTLEPFCLCIVWASQVFYTFIITPYIVCPLTQSSEDPPSGVLHTLHTKPSLGAGMDLDQAPRSVGMGDDSKPSCSALQCSLPILVPCHFSLACHDDGLSS